MSTIHPSSTSTRPPDPRANTTLTPTTSSSTLPPTIPPTNSTVTNFVDNLLAHIPLPRWAIYAICGGGALLLLLCCLGVCIRWRKMKQKRKRKEAQINLKGLNGTTSASLVQPGVEDVGYGSTKQRRGKLLYSLEFNAAQSELTVGIKQAEDLKAMDVGGTSDPYVRVYICPDKLKTCETKVLKNTLNPVFNELFKFKISRASLLKSTVVMQVFDFDRFSKHDTIGELRLRLADIDWNHVMEEWRELAEPSKFEEENLGEICFSLRYVPASGKLTVVILEAKNLKCMDVGGTSDPYVKVQLALDKRKWKKRKTSIKKKTLNPYYNESFTFDVSFDQIQRVNLVISVWDHDPMTPNDPTGKIFLGCDASGNQLKHWADMLSNPRRPVAQWHTLLTAEQVNASLSLKNKIPLAHKLPF